MILTGPQFESFKNALISAFPNYDSLKQMLRIQLGKNLGALVATGPLNNVMFDLIGVAESEGWMSDLLIAARKQNAGNPQLLNFEQTIGITTIDYQRVSLEAQIREADRFIKFDDWISKLLSLEKQVCKVEITGHSSGTGFLISPDIVLTNYHVAEKLIKNELPSSKLHVRFGYKEIGEQVHVGQKYELADDWLIAYSPYSEAERINQELPLPSDDELDYALLRLKEPLPEYGFVAIPQTIESSFFENYATKSPLFIIQHPEGTPLKLALDTQAIIGLNQNGTRLYYQTLTEKGSSGSPCFNLRGELVALHHSGVKGIRNGGIPITKLVQNWQKKNLVELFK